MLQDNMFREFGDRPCGHATSPSGAVALRCKAVDERISSL